MIEALQGTIALFWIRLQERNCRGGKHEDTENLAYPSFPGNMAFQGFLTRYPCGLRIIASG
ncbi:MAG TPA: hypothetical protein DGU45_04005 [Planctomycetes bacterium]|jgi:hypothetical protein|nr:hypothetical protein [Planctomycetota bacterium]